MKYVIAVIVVAGLGWLFLGSGLFNGTPNTQQAATQSAAGATGSATTSGDQMMGTNATGTNAMTESSTTASTTMESGTTTDAGGAMNDTAAPQPQ